MKSTVVVGCTIFIAAVLIGATSGAFHTKCYSCNSGSDMINCKETFGSGITVEKKENCTCCKKEKSNDVWTRGCSTSALDCAQIYNSWTCWSDLCNTAAMIQVKVIVVAMAAALGLAAYLRC